MPLGFADGAWLYVAVAAFVVGHLAVLAYFLRAQAKRSSQSMGPPPEARPDASSDAPGLTRGDRRERAELPPVESEQVVQCPHCGVQNDAEFRFCRFCVGELTGGATVADPGGASRDGQAF